MSSAFTGDLLVGVFLLGYLILASLIISTILWAVRKWGKKHLNQSLTTTRISVHRERNHQS